MNPASGKITGSPEEIQADADKLVRFISMYCTAHHEDSARKGFSFNYGNLPVTVVNGPELCAQCARLLRHAIVMRALCPLDPKPKCRKCPQHCYRPEYREAMEKVMKYAGPRAFLKIRRMKEEG